MHNPIPKFSQSSIITEKPGKIENFEQSEKFEKLKTLTSSNYYRVYYFLLKFCTPLLLNNVYKRMFGVFLFCFDFQLLKKM